MNKECLRWHHGPTQQDPEPGKMWCYDYQQEVWYIDDGYICTGCNKTSDE